SQLEIVVDLAIEDDPHRPVFVGHRLMTGTEVDDGQTPHRHPESSRAADVGPLVVWPAVPNHRRHPSEKRPVRRLTIQPEFSCYTAHGALSGWIAWHSSRYNRSNSLTILSTVNSRSTFRRPSSPRRSTRDGSSRSRTTRSAIASGSPAATRKPVTPSSMTSGVPPTAVATTGTPRAIDSRTALGSPSLSLELSTETRSLLTAVLRASPPRLPRKSTRSAIPTVWTSSRIRPSSGPDPIRCKR